MKTQNTSISVIRAGLISLLVFALCYLWASGISDWPRAWLFIISFAVCLVLMMKSVGDLLVVTYGVAARFSGMAVGRSARLIRRTFLHGRHAA
jgi:hypothetical protein